MTIAIIIIIISALTLTYILFSLDREHEREMNRISQEMNELHEKIDRGTAMTIPANRYIIH